MVHWLYCLPGKKQAAVRGGPGSLKATPLMRLAGAGGGGSSIGKKTWVLLKSATNDNRDRALTQTPNLVNDKLNSNYVLYRYYIDEIQYCTFNTKDTGNHSTFSGTNRYERNKGLHPSFPGSPQSRQLADTNCRVLTKLGVIHLCFMFFLEIYWSKFFKHIYSREELTDVCLAGVAGGLTIAAAPAALTAMGFTAAGVAPGSVAAATQSAVYGGYVASGSAFALAVLQVSSQPLPQERFMRG